MHLLTDILKALSAIALLAIAAVSYVLFYPVKLPGDGTIFYVHPGASRANLVAELSSYQLTHFTPIFDIYTMLRGKVPKSGEFLFPHGSTPYSIWKQITTGTGRYYREITIVPGDTFQQIKDILQKNPYLKHASATMSDRDLMQLLGDAGHVPEGMFMPETYYFSRGDSDLTILKRAHTLMSQKLSEAWNNRAKDLPYQDAYQALIAASLIEKEAYLAKEQPVISGVLVNRLRKNMLLQFDPTIIYGLGTAYQGKIFKKDLTTDTPYNTYIHRGLPPTPIASPGMNAILAAVHPAQHDYLYFVATGDGSHQFTSTLQDHNQAVEKAAANKSVNTTAAGVTNGPR